jgi:hypothetical protein
MLFLQKKANSQILLRHNRRILYREVADARKHEVLERFKPHGTGPCIQKENVRIFEGDLASGAPKPELAIVPAKVSSGMEGKELGELRGAYFFSLAVGPWTGGGKSAMTMMWEMRCRS